MNKPKRFLVRILDVEDKPLHLQLMASIEDAVALFNDMLVEDDFLEDEEAFTIEQGFDIIAKLPIRRDHVE